MILCTVQWNIGGGKIRGAEDDPNAYGIYCQEGLESIIEALKTYQPDIVTLQETHQSDEGDQAKILSEALGLPHFVSDPYDTPHIDPTQKLSQAILSRFPIRQHSFEFFFNPPYRKTMSDGEEWVSHNKGISTVEIEVQGREVVLQTLHMIPYRKFDVDFNDKNGSMVRESIEKQIEISRSPYLLQGDFNHSDISALLPGVFKNGLEEGAEKLPTTPRGRLYDHVLFRGLTLTSQTIDSNVLNDHFPIVSTFELK